MKDFNQLKEEIRTYLQDVNPRYHKRRLKENKILVQDLKERYPELSIEHAFQVINENLEHTPMCSNHNCNNVTSFGQTKGFGKYCSKSCSLDSNKQQNLEKRKITNLQRYGSESCFGNPSIRRKSVDTLIQKYGKGCSPLAEERARSRSEEFNIKAKKTLIEKYSVTNSILVPEAIERRKQTNLKLYGAENYSQSEESKKLNLTKLLDKFKSDKFTITSVINPSIEEKSINPFKNIKFDFICNECGNEENHPYETFKFRLRECGTPCSTCGNVTTKTSIKENNLKQFLENNSIQIQQSVRNLIYPYEVDLFLPDYNIAIEFDGIYWHSELRGKDKEYHLSKTDLCNQKGITLIHIFEDEWDDKQEIVKSRIMNKIGLSEKIYARKCQIKDISPNDAKEFCDQNHIQAGVFCSINYGLFYNDQLISIMSLSKPNISRGKNKDYDYELVRLATKVGCTVVGGASKMFKRFVEDYNPDNIISYSDKRWNSGNIYSVLGFKHNKDTAPNYWYIIDGERKHRFNYSKHKLVEMGYDKNKTEHEIMTNLGHTRIWDCGSSKWIWNKS